MMTTITDEAIELHRQTLAENEKLRELLVTVRRDTIEQCAKICDDRGWEATARDIRELAKTSA